MMTGEEVWSYVQPVLIDAIRDKRLPGEVYMTVSRALMAMDKNGQERTGTDLISRQAAIDAVKQREWLTEDAKEILEEVLTQLPSAQPEIVVCADCKHWICHDRRCGYWNHGVKPLDWCCHAERRIDG